MNDKSEAGTRPENVSKGKDEAFEGLLESDEPYGGMRWLFDKGWDAHAETVAKGIEDEDGYIRCPWCEAQLDFPEYSKPKLELERVKPLIEAAENYRSCYKIPLAADVDWSTVVDRRRNMFAALDALTDRE